MWEKIKKITPDTWARTLCLLVALINQCLAIFGKQALPFAENDIYQIVSILATVVTGAVAWWKNNSFTTVAQTADAVMKQMKAGQLDTDSLQPILNSAPVAEAVQTAEKAAEEKAKVSSEPAAEGAETAANSGTVQEAVPFSDTNNPVVDASSAASVAAAPIADNAGLESGKILPDAADVAGQSGGTPAGSESDTTGPV